MVKVSHRSTSTISLKGGFEQALHGYSAKG
jgi:hypothetical protein